MLTSLRKLRDNINGILEDTTELPTVGAEVHIEVKVPQGSVCTSKPISRKQYASLAILASVNSASQGFWMPSGWTNLFEGLIAEFEELPVIGISWEQGQAFCEEIGGRLPTRHEWHSVHTEWVDRNASLLSPTIVEKLVFLATEHRNATSRYARYSSTDEVLVHKYAEVFSENNIKPCFFSGAIGEWCCDEFVDDFQSIQITSIEDVWNKDSEARYVCGSAPQSTVQMANDFGMNKKVMASASFRPVILATERIHILE